MNPQTLTIIIVSIIAFLVISGIIFTMIVAYIIFKTLLKRDKPEKWNHSYSMPDDPEIVKMFDTGALWREKYINNCDQIYIQNDGLKLYGEYFDFGFDKAVIIIAGRMECCIYSCYFAEPYQKQGYNVLVVDGRAHGFSEGKYNCLGQKEYRDLIAWGKMLHDEKGVQSIVLHGVCIGASASLFTITAEECPEYFEAITVEGMYKNFIESTKNHMKKDKRPIFPFLYEVALLIRLVIGVDAMSDGPYKRIKKLKKPILFLHGKQDLFSLPKDVIKLYDDCSTNKRIVWFEKGPHSRLRINNTEQYDNAITEFLKEIKNIK